ncbi:hypothetical protein V6N13_034888 [Hibiscus sabdariffa]|uniref:Uncharacterized protein n=2 Tax=Hibiscus sabdariffa TaxID=183260 RepID=A0ABR2AXU8_9ROSI
MWGEAAVLADWSSCRLKECAGRSAEMLSFCQTSDGAYPPHIPYITEGPFVVDLVDKTLLNLRIYVHWPHLSRVAYCASKASHRSLTTRSLTTRLVDSQKRSRSMPVHQYPLPSPKGSDPTETATSHPRLATSLRNEKPSFILRIERNSFP